MTDYRFKAFISYRHSDLDSAIASRLQRSLEHFPVPAAIAKRTGHKKVGRIFRDVEELASSSDLFTQLEDNIKQSEFLIVICSPRSKDAIWVQKEIETFLKTHDREHILAVLVEGEPNDAFPPQLLENGEPLAFDLRSDSRNGAYRLCKKNLPRLVAPLIGCSYDDIYNRTRIYKLQRLSAVSALLMVASLTVGVTLWKKNNEITENYTAKLENQSRYLANTSSELLKSGDRERALLVALAALPDEEQERPYVAEARVALADALYLYQHDPSVVFRPEKILSHGADLMDVYASSANENLFLVIDDGYEVYVWDAETLEQKWMLEIGSESKIAYSHGMFPGNGTVLLYNSNRVDCYDMTGSQPIWSFIYPECEQYHIESFLSSPEMSIALDREHGLLYAAPAYWNVEQNGEGRLDITEAHRSYIIDINDGSSTPWRTESWFIGKSTQSKGFGRDILLSSDGSLCGYVVQEKRTDEDSYRTEFLVFPVGQSNASFQAVVEAGAGYAQIVSLEDGIAALIVADDYPVFGQPVQYGELFYTLYAYSLDTGELLYSYSDSCYYNSKKPDVHTGYYALKRGNTIVVRSGNVIVSLDAASGEPLERVESETMHVGQVIFRSGLSVQFHSDGTVQIRSIADSYFPSETYGAYHKTLELEKVKAAFSMNNRYFVLSRNNIYCYAPQNDESFIYETETVPSAGFFAPTGRYYAMLNVLQKTIRIIDCETGEEILMDGCFAENSTRRNSILWVNDTTLAYFAPEGTAVRLFHIEDGSVTEIPLNTAEMFDSPIFGSNAGCNRFAVYYDSTITWRSDESRLQRTPVLIVDCETESVIRSFTAEELFERWHELESDYSGNILAATLTATGRYVLLPNIISLNDGTSTVFPVYDLQENTFIPLNEEITAFRSSTAALRIPGLVSKREDLFLLMENENQFSVINAEDGSVLQRCDVDNLDGNEITFTPDGRYVLYQDSDMRLHLYSLEQQQETYSSRERLNGWGTFCFSGNNGYLISRVTENLSTPITYIHEWNGSTLELVDFVGFCEAVDMDYLVSSNGSDSTRIYRYLTADEMIEKAWQVLDGRTLTDIEKQTYLIE